MRQTLSFNRLLGILIFLLCYQCIHSLDVSVSYARFKSNEQSYCEIYLQVIGKTIVFEKAADSTFYQASAEVLIRLMSGDEIINYDKFQLNSPLTKQVVDFVDLKRIALPDQDLLLVVEIRDLHQPDNQFEFREKMLSSDFNSGSIQSDIQLFASCVPAHEESVSVKQGFEFEVLPYNVYQKEFDQLILYFELYDMDRIVESDFYVSYIIHMGYATDPGNQIMKKHKLFKAKKVNPVLAYLDISGLPSGNYHLICEVHRRDKSIISTMTKEFQRINPEADQNILKKYNKEFELSFVQKLPASDLDELLRMHRPLVASGWAAILSQLLKEGDEKSKRHLLFKIWMDESPSKPESAFLAYLKEVEKANQMFYNNVGHGYTTDRGYIYLKYGVPDDVLTVEDEPSAPPYEIWKYNYMPKTGQTHVKFLFYNPSLAYNDFQLLHSSCRGELDNPRWEITLYKNSPNERIGGDGLEMMDNFGRNARRNFNDF